MKYKTIALHDAGWGEIECRPLFLISFCFSLVVISCFSLRSLFLYFLFNNERRRVCAAASLLRPSRRIYLFSPPIRYYLPHDLP